VTWTTPAPCGRDPVSEVPPGPPATPVAQLDGTELAARGGPASPAPAGRPLTERRGQFAGNGQGTFDESR
jgi:hypothetical protein